MKRNNNLIQILIDQMVIIAGHKVSYDDIIGRKDDWYCQWTMTDDQRKEWIDWGIAYIRKKKRWSKKLAEREMAFIDLYCGLKSSDHTL
jgi:hypothetical protein